MYTRCFGLKDRYCATLLGCWAYEKLSSVTAISAGRKRKALEPLAEPLPNDLLRR
jgi:hypothetical protein